MAKTNEQAEAEIIIKMQAEIDRLRKALKLYGDHLSSCDVRWTLESPKWQPCDCGFEEAPKG